MGRRLFCSFWNRAAAYPNVLYEMVIQNGFEKSGNYKTIWYATNALACLKTFAYIGVSPNSSSKTFIESYNGVRIVVKWGMNFRKYVKHPINTYISYFSIGLRSYWIQFERAPLELDHLPLPNLTHLAPF